MEFLVVSKTKLKAILDKEDMEKYSLDKSSADSSNIGTRRAFREILAVANEAVGFNTLEDKVLIQFYPSRDGGGELFITKLGSLPKSDIRAINRSENVTMLTNVRLLFKFDCLEHLIMASRSMHCKNVKSDVYYIDGAYFLSAEEKCEEGKLNELAKLLEFSERLPEKLTPYVREQGKMILENNALEALARLC